MDIIKKTLEILTNPEKFKNMSEKEQDQFIDEFIEYLKNSKDKMNQAMSFLRFGGHGKAQSITDYMDEIGEESFKKFFKEVILDGKIKTSIGYVNSDNEIKELPFSELDSFFNDMEDFGLTEEQCMEQYSLCYCCDVIREEQKKIGETDDTGKEIKVDTVFNPKPFLQGFYNLFMAFSLIGKDNQFKSLYEKRGIEMAIASLDKKNAEFANYVAKYFKEKNVDGNIAIFNALYFCLVTLTALKPIMFSKNEDDYQNLEDLVIHLSVADFLKDSEKYERDLKNILNHTYDSSNRFFRDDEDEEEDEEEDLGNILPIGKKRESKNKSNGSKDLKDLLLDD